MYTTKQLGQLLHLSPQRVRALAAEGTISASHKTPGGHRRFTDEDLQAAQAAIAGSSRPAQGQLSGPEVAALHPVKAPLSDEAFAEYREAIHLIDLGGVDGARQIIQSSAHLDDISELAQRMQSVDEVDLNELSTADTHYTRIAAAAPRIKREAKIGVGVYWAITAVALMAGWFLMAGPTIEQLEALPKSQRHGAEYQLASILSAVALIPGAFVAAQAAFMSMMLLLTDRTLTKIQRMDPQSRAQYLGKIRFRVVLLLGDSSSSFVHPALLSALSQLNEAAQDYTARQQCEQELAASAQVVQQIISDMDLRSPVRSA